VLLFTSPNSLKTLFNPLTICRLRRSPNFGNPFAKIKTATRTLLFSLKTTIVPVKLLS